jgi:hypothetical protein
MLMPLVDVCVRYQMTSGREEYHNAPENQGTEEPIWKESHKHGASHKKD